MILGGMNPSGPGNGSAGTASSTQGDATGTGAPINIGSAAVRGTSNLSVRFHMKVISLAAVAAFIWM